jgi:hypothetical protein
MKLFHALASLLLVQGIPSLVGPLIPDNTAVVTGIVRRADTSRAIPEAQVALRKPGETIEQAMTHAVLTDNGGRFTIRNVPGGAYQVVAQAEGLFKPANDTPSAPWVTTDLALFEGQQVSGVILELIPGATISGRVTDAEGRRLPNAPVEALQPDYVRGRLVLTPVKTMLADDLGEYRLFWIPAGSYYVRARTRLSDVDHPERYAPMFFPGIADEDVAPIVSLSPGGEASAIDVRVDSKPVAGVTISGRVSSAIAELSDARALSVYVVPRDRTVTLMTDTADAFRNEAAVESAGGQFLIRGLLPGEYNLFPILKDGDGKVYTARIPLDVEDKDIADVSGTVFNSVELKGRITVDGRTGPVDAANNRVVLTSLDGLPGILLNLVGEGQPRTEAAAIARINSETGEFSFPRVPAGRYAVRLAAPLEAADSYLADVRQIDRSVFDDGFVVGEDASEPVELAIRSRGGTVLGTVLDTSMVSPFPRATVVLVPDAPHRRNLVLYKTAISSQEGTFILNGIAPGDYKVFAWETIPAGAWENPAFLRRYDDRGIPVRVEGNEKTVRLRVIGR